MEPKREARRVSRVSPYLFGCCSVPGRTSSIGWRAYRELDEGGHLVDADLVIPHPRCACDREPPHGKPRSLRCDQSTVSLPPLMRVYLSMGAKVYSEPAWDRDFGVVDFLIVLDTHKLEPRLRRRYFTKANSRSHRYVAQRASRP